MIIIDYQSLGLFIIFFDYYFSYIISDYWHDY